MSAGLSSTIRISGVFIFFSIPLPCDWFHRQGEFESRSQSWFRFHPDPAPELLNNFLADGKPDAVAGIFCAGVQSPENYEHSIHMLSRVANTFVLIREHPVLCFRLYC